MDYVYGRLEKEDMVPTKEVEEYLKLDNSEKDSMVIMGILVVFSANGVFKKVNKGVFGL